LQLSQSRIDVQVLQSDGHWRHSESSRKNPGEHEEQSDCEMHVRQKVGQVIQILSLGFP
jgi:hypothetical protein